LSSKQAALTSCTISPAASLFLHRPRLRRNNQLGDICKVFQLIFGGVYIQAQHD
jgi:hypothetical protein